MSFLLCFYALSFLLSKYLNSVWKLVVYSNISATSWQWSLFPSSRKVHISFNGLKAKYSVR